ncbi:WD40 repeat-like protein [Melanomma pulvis-pyrius CBS 109.77]|uniref:WD40 repeat-like protein n=1 Tax=Melanomma pulvis-pyrius CBS 109.77 TaxID=1314802 RepID=A0A6A6XVP9_9PLEO|nr:WD40 repeat-like protein [Melanomma pulvis-pyrius CBS 109.77]
MEVRDSAYSTPRSFSGPVNFSPNEERGSGLSNSPYHGVETELHTSIAPIPTAQNAGLSKFTNRFTEEECHLIIFLKEVKKLTWREIGREIPNRKVGSIQTHYSQKLNKRNRAEDPLRLKLPRKFAAESVIDWTTVHQECPGPYMNPAPIRFQRPPQIPSAYQLHNSVPPDESSANESGPPKVRPRRTAPQVNYAWPRRNRISHADDDLVMEDLAITDVRSMSTPTRSSEALEEPSLGPEVVIPVDKPMNVNFEQEDASLAVSLFDAGRPVTSGQKLPYLSFAQRLVLQNDPKDGEWEQLSGRDWQGSVVHVDFNYEEEQIVERTIRKIVDAPQVELSRNRRKQLQKLLKAQPEHKILQLEYEVRRKLFTRDQESIKAFLKDAITGKLHANPHIQRIGAVRPDRTFSSAPKASASSLVRQRELGLQSRRGWKSSFKPLSYQMQNKVHDSLGPAYSFTGASNDVHTVAWDPDGQNFAAGAVCVTDPDSMQYNRPNNLLYGDLLHGTIHELGEHHISRPRTNAGPNSTHAMYMSQDPVLYTTISSVAFSPLGEYMYSAGYDDHACIWRTSRDGSQPELLKVMKHRAPVDILTVGCHGKVATAAKKWTSNAVKVISMNDGNPNGIDKQSYTSAKALKQPNLNILPTALQFEPNYGRLLLAGFGANSKESGDRLDANGDICLWDVETQQQLTVHGSGKNVFDVAFNPNQRHQPLFAVGCVAGHNVNKGTRSLLRLYDGDEGKYSRLIEIECAALDMNDVVWCPYDENLIAAGCTSGRTYVWDIRRPDDYLYCLSHGKSLAPLDDFTDREVTDTGVRFLSWGHNATRLYSGSSDGVVKVWDVVGSPQDVFIKDLITGDSGIMSGAFSPDKSKLIVGEVNGSINILEVGRDDCSVKDAERLKYLPYQSPNDDNFDSDMKETTLGADSGRDIASKLLESGQLISRPMGGLPIYQTVQGPNYVGPFDISIEAPFLREQALEFQLNFAMTPTPQCRISSCREISKITFEETGYSGRSEDRIPDELRKQWKLTGSGHITIPGKAKCTDCGRPAPPMESTANADGAPSCERCSFACFRCGAISQIQPETEYLVCTTCKRTWEIGALGYECVQESDLSLNRAGVLWDRKTRKRVERLKRKAARPSSESSASFLEENSSFGDEVNALTDYYLSLAIARPESPPL